MIDALRSGGIEVVAIHNHMLGGEPAFIFLHFQARGDAAALARTIRRAWDEMERPHHLPERKAARAPTVDWKAVSEAIGITSPPPTTNSSSRRSGADGPVA